MEFGDFTTEMYLVEFEEFATDGHRGAGDIIHLDLFVILPDVLLAIATVLDHRVAVNDPARMLDFAVSRRRIL